MSQQLGAGGRDQQEHPQLRGEGRALAAGAPLPHMAPGPAPCPKPGVPSDL